MFLHTPLHWLDGQISVWEKLILIQWHWSVNGMNTMLAGQLLKPFMFLSLRVPSNCQRDFNLLAFDPDGDEVKCRYGNVTLFECNPCRPASVLSLSSVSSQHFHPQAEKRKQRVVFKRLNWCDRPWLLLDSDWPELQQTEDCLALHKVMCIIQCQLS